MDWYFQCHMPGDPVQPGCLCVDAIWQLLGFYCCWKGGLGGGRALGSEEIIFNGQGRPYNKTVRYEVDVKRFSNLKGSGSSIVIGDGRVLVDDELIMTVKEARAGIFKGIVYPDYPKRSPHALGHHQEGNYETDSGSEMKDHAPWRLSPVAERGSGPRAARPSPARGSGSASITGGVRPRRGRFSRR
jgi:3-hydroxymyristoyl/3-hydroxydecanoyl-(acyl carrier protein) dehydratase